MVVILNKKNAYILIIGILIAYFFQGVIHNLGHPVTPDYVKGLEFTDQMFGYFFAAMNLGLVVGSPLFGYLGDRSHRKFYVVLGMFMYGVFQLLFGVINFSPYLMILFRFFAGFFVAAPATLILAEVIGRIDAKDRIKILSAMIALNTLGASIGYQLGGWLGTLLSSQEIVFIIQSITNTFLALGLFLFIQFHNKTVEPVSKRTTLQFKKVKQLIVENKSLFVFFIILMLMNMAFINVSKYLDIFIVNDLGYTSSQLGTFVMVTGIIAMLTNLLIVPLFIKDNKATMYIKWMLLIGFITLLSTFLFPNETIMTSLYSIFLIYVMSRSIITPLEQGHISTYAKDSNYGTIMGMRQLFISMASIVGPIMGGYLYAYNKRLVFLVSVAILGFSFVMVLFTTKKPSQRLQDSTKIS